MTALDTAVRALALSQSGEDCFDALEPEAQEALRENVRAVLGAIREPSEAMKLAGATAVAPNIVDVPEGATYYEAELEMKAHCLAEAHGSWIAMIDAALVA